MTLVDGPMQQDDDVAQIDQLPFWEHPNFAAHPHLEAIDHNCKQRAVFWIHHTNYFLQF